MHLKYTSLSTKFIILSDVLFSKNLASIRPAKTISDGSTTGQCTPRHSCLCSVISSLFCSESLLWITSEAYSPRSLGIFLKVSFFSGYILNICPPARIWHWWEQYNGIEHDKQGTLSAGRSFRQ